MINQNVIEEILSRKHQSIARAISIIEDNNPDNIESILSKIYNKTGRAYRIGITGPPGSGKSSIANEIIKLLSPEKNIAVLSVDPTSPFTGGAILGDRIRMIEHYDNPNVFIRSIGSRGSKGGLADNISFSGDILDAAGFDIILFETVGVGQIELDVMETSDSTVVVLVPESGDDIQMMKAGVVEIADIYVINKSDRKDANKLYASLKNMLSLLDKDKKNNWIPPIIKTVGTEDKGVDELVSTLSRHKEKSKSSGQNFLLKSNKRYIKNVYDTLQNQLNARFWDESKKKILDDELKKNVQKRLSPLKLVKKIINDE